MTTTAKKGKQANRFGLGDSWKSFREAIELFYEKGWTDGFPVIPPTDEDMQAMLSAVKRDPQEVIGVVPPRLGVATVESVAANAVMAGCKPEYLKVVLAAVEAMLDEHLNLNGVQATTNACAPLAIVSGPVVQEIGLNSSTNLFGHGYRANATIGRAVRLIIMNVTGGIPGVMDKSTLGQGGKYSMCITENLDASPWEPFHVTRGFKPEENAVSVIAVHSPLQFIDHSSNTPEALLTHAADDMSVMGKDSGAFVFVICPEHARIFRNAGWTRRQAMEYLHQHAVVSTERLKKQQKIQGAIQPGDAGQFHHAVKTVDGLILLVAGGEAGGFSDLISLWGGGHLSLPVTKPIHVPGGRP